MGIINECKREWDGMEKPPNSFILGFSFYDSIYLSIHLDIHDNNNKHYNELLNIYLLS